MYHDWGIAYVRKDDYDKAIEDFTRAVNIEPNYAETYNIRGNVYAVKSELDRAIADYTEAPRLDPGNANAKKKLAGNAAAEPFRARKNP